MDGSQFDDLTRSFTLASRRSLLSAVGAAVVVVLLGSDASDDVSAKRKRPKGKRQSRRNKHSRGQNSRARDAQKSDRVGSEKISCDDLCKIIKKLVGGKAKTVADVCDAACKGQNVATRVVRILGALGKENLLKASQFLKIVEVLAEKSLLSFEQFADVVAKLVKQGFIGLCNGEVDRLCIAGPGHVACCGDDQPCQDGFCRCSGNKVFCGGQCLDPCPSPSYAYDPGTCQCVCMTSSTCDDGTCLECPQGARMDRASCTCSCFPSTLTLCNGQCVNTSTDPANCGECDQPCQGATCERASCSRGQCTRTPIAGCCTSDAQCNDNNICTRDTCDLATNTCVHQPIAGCCTSDAQCTTTDPCSTDTCDRATNTCVHTPVAGCCRDDGECEDHNPCTTDTCDPGTNQCSNRLIAGCCRSDGECPSCEKCSSENRCVADLGKDNTSCDTDMICCGGTCCAPGVPCADGACQPPPPPQCSTSADCDDNDPCTRDICEAGQCRNDPIPDCGGECVCPPDLLENGSPCTDDAECCSTYCDFYSPQPVCAPPEGCLRVGSPCAGGHCCSGLCGEDCQCACLDAGDTTCSEDRQCCGGHCTPTGCCTVAGQRCRSGSECCSGFCIDAGYNDDDGVRVFECNPGAAGTACRGDGDCKSRTCCDNQCCPGCANGGYCGVDPTTIQEFCACF